MFFEVLISMILNFPTFFVDFTTYLQLCGAVCNVVDEDSGVFHSLRLPIRKSKK